MSSIVVATIGGVVFGSYLLSSYPSVGGGDSGELLAEACQLGVAHPPGYPLFILLSNVLSKLPFPRPFLTNGRIEFDLQPTSGWKMTQLSTMCGALTAVFIFWSVLLCVGPQKNSALLACMGAGIAALSFAFTPLVWEYSISAEVFALNNFLCSVVLFLTLKVSSISIRNKIYTNAPGAGKSPSLPMSMEFGTYTLLGAYLSGLSFANQHTSLLNVSFLVLVVSLHLFTYHSPLSALLLLTSSGLAFLLGISPYLHLYWAAKEPRLGSWGDTKHWSGLITHVLRAEYGTFRLGFIEGSETALERIIYYFVYINEQMLNVPVLVLALFVVTCLLSSVPGKSPRKSIAAPLKASEPRGSDKKNAKKAPGIAQKTSNSVNASEQTDAQVKSHSLFAQQGTVTLISIVLGNFLWYTLLWHGVFSNLPLSNPMAFNVHSRFWMQPSISLAVLIGVLLTDSLHRLASLRTQSLVSSSLSQVVASILPLSVLAIFASYLVARRWTLLDRAAYASGGWIMHQHGENILRNLDDGAILLSHTDLDLNPVRYLQLCENSSRNNNKNSSTTTKYPRIHHISLQMLPYPWFRINQQPLYETHGIRFAETNFPGVSTDRLSQGNARLITDFLALNLPTQDQHQQQQKKKKNRSNKKSQKTSDAQTVHGRKIFLDMQSVNEAELGSHGQWRGYTLVPYGLQYLVLSPHMMVNQTELETRYHGESWRALQRVIDHFPVIDEAFHVKYPKGTWEAAAMNVFFDAHYQLGLFYLTWAMDQESNINIDTLSTVVDRLLAARELLQKTWHAASKYQTFSSSVKDLHKNTALCDLRLQALLLVVRQMAEKIRPVWHSLLRHQPDRFLHREMLEALIDEDHSTLQETLQKAASVIQGFAQDHPEDKDAGVFLNAAKKLLTMI